MLKKTIVLLLVILSINSCKKDLIQPKPSDLNGIKKWYVDNSVILATERNWLNGLTPNWNKVQEKNGDRGNVYEISLINPRKIFGTSEKIEIKTIRKLASKSTLRLLVFENEFGPGYKACFMEIIATGDGALPATLSYKDYGNLTGLVNFYELDGTLANGWIYSGGKVIKSTNGTMVVGSAVANIGGRNKLMLLDVGSVECGRVSVPHVRSVCVGSGGVQGWGYGGDGGNVTCHDEVYYTSEILYCPLPDDSPGGGYAGSGGNGNGQNGDASNDPDCAKAKAQATSEKYKEKANELKGKLDQRNETGFEEKKDGTFNPLSQSGSNSLNADPDANSKGYIHTHTNSYQNEKPDGTVELISSIHMFSPGDVDKLMKLIDKNRNSGNYSDFYVSMVSSSGHYMLKFGGTASDIQLGFGGDYWANEYRDFMSDYYNLEKGFLKFVNEKMGLKGIKLYEIKNDGTVKAIELKPNGNGVDKKDC